MAGGWGMPLSSVVLARSDAAGAGLWNNGGMLETLLAFFGRTHPLLLHVPIGVLAAMLTLEALGVWRRKAPEWGTRRDLAGLLVLSAAGAGVSGWLLAEEDYGGSTVTLHRWLAVGFVVGCLMLAVGAWRRSVRIYGAFVVVATGLCAAAGHFGGTITHGRDFLTEPFFKKPPPARSNRGADSDQTALVEPVSIYTSVIEPIFADKCVSCHGPDKQKGGLAMHTPEDLLFGGDTGPAFVAGDPDHSEMVWRLRLPLEDEYRMPPKEKPQLTDAEVAAIIKWIADGASFD
ncbi:MAG: hypothetical protein D6692_10285 [Planctomycetota bacterium]|nr:MAG: hypothetical protein D6692_10285 [Planctomycetota bacterium]